MGNGTQMSQRGARRDPRTTKCDERDAKPRQGTSTTNACRTVSIFGCQKDGTFLCFWKQFWYPNRENVSAQCIVSLTEPTAEMHQRHFKMHQSNNRTHTNICKLPCWKKRCQNGGRWSQNGSRKGNLKSNKYPVGGVSERPRE